LKINVADGEIKFMSDQLGRELLKTLPTEKDEIEEPW
jgi:hypothetical protein